MIRSRDLARPAPTEQAGTTLTLDADLLELVGVGTAWKSLYLQLADRRTMAPEVAFSQRLIPLWSEMPGVDDPPLLWHLVEADPTMLARVTWTPDEHRVASALLDRAVSEHLGSLRPGRTRVIDIDFWTSGRLAVVMDRPIPRYLTVPTASLPWLSTGDWSATQVVPLGRGHVTTTEEGTQEWRGPDGVLHRDDGPARITSDGKTAWYHQGRAHRADGPAITCGDGILEWWRHGDLHRDDGPARLWPDGSQEWIVDGARHRDDGPAVVMPDGSQSWFRHGVRHRDDGPAVVRPDGTQGWWRNGMVVGLTSAP